MPLITFDGREASDFKSILDFGIDYVNTTTTGTNSVTRTRTFTANGDGLLFVSGSVWTNTTSDTGSIRCILKHNGVTVAANGNRFFSSTAENQASQVSAFLKVESGDEVTVQITTTKNGAKTFYWEHLGIGCSAVQSGG